ncbi:unnamed protein product, partial [Symbiodinium sp. CCMP2456]
EFLHEALKVTHPFDSAVAIDGPNLRAIAYVLEHGVKGVEQKRRAVLEHYKALERSLHDEEQRLKQGMASRDPDVARAVWKESLEQVGKGWLSGPFTWDQMDEKYGGAWVASKRFGVTQGDKVRAVDDLSQFQVNASVTETEKIQLEGLDDIVALARFMHPDDDWSSILGVLDTDSNQVVYFESFALPFGASSAVTGFNRAARALRIIMSRLLYLVNTSFFDDYCQMELEGLTDSADYAALELLRLLGWEVSEGEKLRILLGVPRCAQVATQLIHHAERASGGQVSDGVVGAVRAALATLADAGDRVVNLWSEQPPILLFTDGACEERGSLVTHGAVLIDPASQTKEFFGDHIPAHLVQQWRDTGRSQLIFFAELFPIV